MKVLGAFLRDKRKELNLTIQDVADKLDLKYGTVANMESGGKNPTLKQLEDYGLIFGIGWGEILLEVLKIVGNNIDNFSENLNEFVDEGKSYREMQFAEFHEFEEYHEEINKEYEARRQAEDEKINIDIDAVIDIIIKRYTTKESTPVNPKEIIFLREEIKSIIKNRVIHLLSR